MDQFSRNQWLRLGKMDEVWCVFPFIKNFITKKYIFWRKFRKQNLVRIEEKVFWLVGCSCVQKRKKCRMVWSIFSDLWSRLLNFSSKTVHGSSSPWAVRSPKIPPIIRSGISGGSFFIDLFFIHGRRSEKNGPVRGPKLFCWNVGPISDYGPDQISAPIWTGTVIWSGPIIHVLHWNEDKLENMKAAPLFNWPISVKLISPPASHWSKTIFKKPFYRAGINDSGIKRISKLAIQRDLPLNFVIALNNVYGLPSNDVIIDQENLKNKISDLLNDVEISNECIGTVR